jgi:hypothetical protein
MASDTTTVPADQQPYKSLPLPNNVESGFIRILDLHSDVKDAPLAATLRVINLDSGAGFEFTALSYVWGQQRSPVDTITCNGFDLPITASCHDALQALREMHGAITIWVDAICISQGDASEKSAQIPLMGRIYSIASTVYIWLGQGNAVFSQALKVVSAASQLGASRYASLVDTLTSHPKSKPVFNEATDVRDKASQTRPKKGYKKSHTFLTTKLRENWVPSSLRYFISFPHNWLCLFKEVKKLKKMEKQLGIAIEQFNLDCEWLHRAWTFQELMLAKNPVFLWGTTEFNLNQLKGSYYFIPVANDYLSRVISFRTAFGIVASTAMDTFVIPWGISMAQHASVAAMRVMKQEIALYSSSASPAVSTLLSFKSSSQGF